MTIDQKIQIWVAVGTWVSGLGSLAAAGVALYLSRRGEKLRLRVEAGFRLIDTPGHESPERCVGIQVTNLGDRPVTIDSMGWPELLSGWSDALPGNSAKRTPG